MYTLIWILLIILIICAASMVVLVLMQDTKSSGLGSSFGGNTDSFFGRNKSKTRESRLAFLTKMDAGVIAILCITLVLMLKYYSA